MENYKKTTMVVKECAIGLIHPYPGNPRKTTKAVKPVANSIQRFGFRQPIVVDENKTIIAGHVRYQAAKNLGLKKVPIHIATDLTPSQVSAFRIADNRSHEYSEWDVDRLKEELSEMCDSNIDVEELEMDIRSLIDERFGHDMSKVMGFTPVDVSTQPRLDRKKPIVCPECGHEYST